MSSIRAIIVDRNIEHLLRPGDVPFPQAQPHEALIRVAAISLNRGEVRRAASAEDGYRPGWDFAGVVEQAASDGTGPQPGERVVGTLPSGAWAEVVAAPPHALAVLPDTVSFAQAATLPIAGLTALYAIERAGNLRGQRVLITGASGGVGHFAVQLAHHAGAQVVALIRSERWHDQTREAGANQIIIAPDAEPAGAFAPYNLILDGVGGQTLSQALGYVAADGLVVTYGRTAGREVAIDLKPFFDSGAPGSSIYSLLVFHEFEREPASAGLQRLLNHVAEGVLNPLIGLEASWTEVGAAAQQLMSRDFPGKAVLTIP